LRPETVNNYPIYAPNTVFRLENAAPIKKVHQGVARREMCPLLLESFEGAVVPLIANKNGFVRG
jgi:hypothetical protein